MRAEGVLPDGPLYSQLVQGLVRAGRLGEALRLHAEQVRGTLPAPQHTHCARSR